MAGASFVLVACLAVFGALPVLAQDGGGPEGNDVFDDEPSVKPAPPSADRRGAPDSNLPPDGPGAPPDAAAEVERQVEAAPEPAAVAAKLAIRDALVRKDMPAARQLFADALKQFPLDRDLREVQERRALFVHNEIARSILGRTIADSAKLYGRPWLPGKTMPDGEVEYELVTTRSGKRVQTSEASVDEALAKGYAYIGRGDPTSAEKVPDLALVEYKRAAEIDPNRYGELYQNRVRALHEEQALNSLNKKDYKQLLAETDAILASDPANAKGHTLRGLAFLHMGKVEEAIKASTLALKSDPNAMWALRYRGEAMDVGGAAAGAGRLQARGRDRSGSLQVSIRRTGACPARGKSAALGAGSVRRRSDRIPLKHGP